MSHRQWDLFEGAGRHEPSPRDDMGAGLPRQRALDILGVRDDGVGAAALEEGDHRLDLRSHAALREVRPLGQELLRFQQGEPVDPLLVGPSPPKSFCRFCWSAYPIAPWVSAPITSSGTSWSSCAASSDRRRMNPTCGPFPCVMATSQPSLIIPAMCHVVSAAAMYWSRTD